MAMGRVAAAIFFTLNEDVLVKMAKNCPFWAI